MVVTKINLIKIFLSKFENILPYLTSLFILLLSQLIANKSPDISTRACEQFFLAVHLLIGSRVCGRRRYDSPNIGTCNRCLPQHRRRCNDGCRTSVTDFVFFPKEDGDEHHHSSQKSRSQVPDRWNQRIQIGYDGCGNDSTDPSHPEAGSWKSEFPVLSGH